MAIYHFTAAIISRAKGRSSVAAAARHACEPLYDARLGKTVRIVQKHNNIFKKILLPDNAPVWMANREKLWNTIEKLEKRKDSQLARDIQFSLPEELSSKQVIELTEEFVQNEFVNHGMVADICIHIDKTQDEQEQAHAHVMLTMRTVNNDDFGLKDRSWNSKKIHMEWRKSWAEYANKYLALNGIDQKIDHRTYIEQGINLIPQNKLGVEKNLKDRERRLEERQRIAQENGKTLLANPIIALKAISLRQKIFTEQVLVKFIRCYTVDEDQFKIVYEKVKIAPQLKQLSINEHGVAQFSFQEQ